MRALRDGETLTVTEWAAGSPANTVERRVRWMRGERANTLGTRVEYGQRGYKGTARRQVRITNAEGRAVARIDHVERCGCLHRKRSAAAECGTWLAGRLNSGRLAPEAKNTLPEEDSR